MTSRRAVLGGLLALSVATAVPACSGPTPRTARLAAGEPGGFFWEFSGLLADAGRRRRSVTIDPMRTAGSIDNLVAIRSGTADLAMTLADVAAGSDDLFAVGRVYENYFQVAVRDDSPVTTMDGLRGRTVSVGAEGSGATSLSARVLDAVGLDEPGAIRAVRQPMRAAARALVAGQVDVAMWAGGLPTPAFTGLGRGIRLLDMTSVVSTLRQRHGIVYEAVTVPENVYGAHPAVTTVGVGNLLLARRDLDDRVVASVVDLLLDDASALVPEQAVGSQFLDAQSLIQTAGMPLHPGAASEYRRRHG